MKLNALPRNKSCYKGELTSLVTDVLLNDESCDELISNLTIQTSQS